MNARTLPFRNLLTRKDESDEEYEEEGILMSYTLLNTIQARLRVET